MQKKIITTVFVLIMGWTTNAWSICQEAQIPSLPNPDWVDESDVQRAQRAVKRYIQQQEIFLSCVNSASRHNAALDRMQDIADKFNTMARRYKARQKSMNVMTDLAFYWDRPVL